MLSHSRKLLLSLAAVATLGLAAPSAGAFSIVATDLPHGDSFVNLGFATAFSTTGFFSKKVVAGFTSTGVSVGFEGGEIDLSFEALTFSFVEPQIVTGLALANLYLAHEHDDVENERAMIRVTFGDGSIADYSLAVDTATTATFSGPGTVSNVSPGLFGDGGVWSISSPFGSAAVKSIKLLPLGPVAPQDMRNNDYGFYSLDTVAVPEPGSLVLVAAGLLGLTIAGRRRTLEA